MAITEKIKTSFGEERECYIRLNNMETSNHGMPAKALFRAFLSQAAFKDGAHYVAEFDIEFDADVSKPIWKQAYVSLIKQENLKDADEV